jgi:hypothetical protein
MKYFFYPTPLPSYTITNPNQVDQTVNLSEPNTAASVDNNFYYFPSMKKCATTAQKPWCNQTLASSYDPLNLPGPLIVGPHSYAHYAYRGRMIAEQVTFKFEVNDNHNVDSAHPFGNAVAIGQYVYKIPNGISKTSDPATYVSRDDAAIVNSSGVNNAYNTLVPTLPTGYTYDHTKDCFRSDIIDYQERDGCRSVTFFIPNTNDNLLSKPVESDKLTFLNAGLYTFTLDATENQKYYYQHDDGEEYQGSRTNPSTLPDGWTTPHLTQSVDSNAQSYTIRNDVNNHCELPTDGFGNPTTGSKYCFHDNSKEYQYWIYKWSGVKRYNKDFLATWN